MLVVVRLPVDDQTAKLRTRYCVLSRLEKIVDVSSIKGACVDVKDKHADVYLHCKTSGSKTSVSSSTPTNAIIYDAYTSLIKKNKKKKK